MTDFYFSIDWDDDFYNIKQSLLPFITQDLKLKRRIVSFTTMLEFLEIINDVELINPPFFGGNYMWN